jgi:ElaA protein
VTELQRRTGEALTAAELYAILAMRVNIFIIEQKSLYPDLDGRDLDPSTVHLWWQPADIPLAYLRILTEPDGPTRIGRVCTLPEARGTGLGSRLMTAAMAELADHEITLNAQVDAQGLYARFGFVPTGEPFDDDGIMHITMNHHPG